MSAECLPNVCGTSGNRKSAEGAGPGTKRARSVVSTTGLEGDSVVHGVSQGEP